MRPPPDGMSESTHPEPADFRLRRDPARSDHQGATSLGPRKREIAEPIVRVIVLYRTASYRIVSYRGIVSEGESPHIHQFPRICTLCVDFALDQAEVVDMAWAMQKLVQLGEGRKLGGRDRDRERQRDRETKRDRDRI